jgi:Uma2 family endonuclease
MGFAQKITSLTVDEYLTSERTSKVRHEFIDGQVHAMAGGTINHNRLTMNFGSLLNSRMSGKGCEAFTENVVVKISEAIYYYPDVVVTCNPVAGGEYVVEYPVLIVEVLSKSTEKIDRREKKKEYQFVAGLREYVIVAQDHIRIEVYRHENAAEMWQGEVYSEPEQEIVFVSTGVKIRVSEIYQRVSFPDNSKE